jgi:hypothetical protein
MPGSIDGQFSLGRTIFADKRIVPLIVSWFAVAFFSNVPLLLNDAFGEDPSGFCGAKKFSSVLLLSFYLSTLVLIWTVSLILTAIYYYRLIKWLKANQNATTGGPESIDYTRCIMRVMKIVTLIPIFCMLPVAILTSAQMLLTFMPISLNRLLVVPYFWSAACTPWLTIRMLKPFRRRFIQVIRTAKTIANFSWISWIFVDNSRTRTDVQEIVPFVLLRYRHEM